MQEDKKHTHGFKVPDGYFKNFDEELMNRMGEVDWPEATGFNVPDGYFEQLEVQVMAKVAVQSEPRVIPLFQRKVFWYTASIAACMALIAGIFLNSPESEDPFSDLAQEDIQAYFESEMGSLDGMDLAQLLTDEEVDELSGITGTFSEESLESYLLEHIDDTSLLIE